MLQPVDHILASIYYRAPADQKVATSHARRLMAHANIFLEAIDRRLWKYVRDFMLKERVAPSEKVLRSLAERDMAMEVVERMDLLKKVEVCTEDDFKHFLQTAFEEVKHQECSILLSTAAQILGGNYEPPKGGKARQGYQEAVRYVLEHGLDFMHDESRGQKLRGDIRKDGAEMVKKYERAKANRRETVGILTGFDTVDLQTQGIRRGELWLIAGFTSDGKTTACLNIAHNAVTKGYNVMYASMEMSRAQIEEILYCIHSGHKKFTNIHGALSLNDVRRGELDAEAEEFYLKHVIPDFEDNPNYGALEVIQPDSIWTAEMVQAEAELLNEKLAGGLDLVIPDYVGLMGVDGRSEGRNEDLNRIIRGLKQMTLTFGGGAQISVLSPFQCNRDGRSRAEGRDKKKSKKSEDDVVEQKGVYDLQALSSAHEAERSSDVVLSIFMDDALRARNEAILCQLKGRDTGCAPPRTIHAHMASRIVRENPPCSMALEDANWLNNLMVGV